MLGVKRLLPQLEALSILAMGAGRTDALPLANQVDGSWPLASLVRPPRIAALFQLGHDVIGDGEALVFTKPFLRTAYDLPRPAKGVGY